MARFSLDEVLAVLTSLDCDLDDAADQPYRIDLRPAGGARHEVVAELTLTPLDDPAAAETFDVTIRRSGDE